MHVFHQNRKKTEFKTVFVLAKNDSTFLKIFKKIFQDRLPMLGSNRIKNQIKCYL